MNILILNRTLPLYIMFIAPLLALFYSSQAQALSISFDTLGTADGNSIENYSLSGDCLDNSSDQSANISIQVSDTNASALNQTDISCTESRFSTQINISTLLDGQISFTVTISANALSPASDTNSLLKNACSPDNSSAFCDSDLDGIYNPDETTLGLNPFVADSDSDGIPDLLEVGNDLSSPLDSDGDNVIDALDSDSDNDSLSDASEAGSNSSSPRDSDTDGLPDYRDRDSDNDRIPDFFEARIGELDADNDSIPNYLDRDSDGDKVPDAWESGIDTPRDSDNDGIDDYYDIDNTGGQDNDNNGFDDTVQPLNTDRSDNYDWQDIDSDNDGMRDLLEANLVDANDSDADGIVDTFDVDNTGGNDTNSDGIDDAFSLLDTDNDGQANLRDLDSDNDGLSDVSESGGSDTSPIDAMVDSEASATFSPLDTDGDMLPNHLELESSDTTNDGAAPFDISALANASLDQNNDGQIDNTTDRDNDGIADAVDQDTSNFGSPVDIDQDGIPNNTDLDDDNDGIPDILEGDHDTDTDGDGQPDFIDLDSDNDGLTDLREANTQLIDDNNDGRVDSLLDANNDGHDDSISSAFVPSDSDEDETPDHRDLDSDGDTVHDLVEANDTDSTATSFDGDSNGQHDLLGLNGLTHTVFTQPPDTDEDGMPDYLDTDSDNDGFSDALETGDANNNQINDRLENTGGELSTNEQGGAGSSSFIILGLLSCLLLKRSSIRILFFLLILFKSHTVYAADDLCARFIENDTSNALLKTDIEPETFQRCIYGFAGLGSAYLAPSGSSNGWSLDDDRSVGLGLGLGWSFTPKWAMEMFYGYYGKAGLGNTNPSIDAAIDAGIKYQGASFMLKRELFDPHKPWNAYIKLGLSWLKTKQTHATVNYVAESTSQVSVGIGAAYHFDNSPWFTRLDYTSIARDTSFSAIQIGRYFGHQPTRAKVTQYTKVPYDNLHLKQDSDGDGIFDDLDRCPTTPPNTEVNAVGCCTEKEGCLQLF